MFIYGSAKKPDEKKSKEQTLAELSPLHRRSRAKCQLVQTSYIKRIKLRSVCTHDLGQDSPIQTD